MEAIKSKINAVLFIVLGFASLVGCSSKSDDEGTAIEEQTLEGNSNQITLTQGQFDAMDMQWGNLVLQTFSQEIKVQGEVKLPVEGMQGSHTFTFVDSMTGSRYARAWYQLQGIDMNGQTSKSNRIEVEWPNLSSTGLGIFAMYPNPSSGEVTLDFTATSKVWIEIHDQTSRKVFQSSIPMIPNQTLHKTTLDLRFLSSGVYLLSIFDETTHRSIKFIKN